MKKIMTPEKENENKRKITRNQKEKRAQPSNRRTRTIDKLKHLNPNMPKKYTTLISSYYALTTHWCNQIQSTVTNNHNLKSIQLSQQ